MISVNDRGVRIIENEEVVFEMEVVEVEITESARKYSTETVKSY